MSLQLFIRNEELQPFIQFLGGGPDPGVQPAPVAMQDNIQCTAHGLKLKGVEDKGWAPQSIHGLTCRIAGGSPKDIPLASGDIVDWVVAAGSFRRPCNSSRLGDARQPARDNDLPRSMKRLCNCPSAGQIAVIRTVSRGRGRPWSAAGRPARPAVAKSSLTLKRECTCNATTPPILPLRACFCACAWREPLQNGELYRHRVR